MGDSAPRDERDEAAKHESPPRLGAHLCGQRTTEHDDNTIGTRDEAVCSSISVLLSYNVELAMVNIGVCCFSVVGLMVFPPPAARRCNPPLLPIPGPGGTPRAPSTSRRYCTVLYCTATTLHIRQWETPSSSTSLWPSSTFSAARAWSTERRSYPTPPPDPETGCPSHKCHSSRGNRTTVSH